MEFRPTKSLLMALTNNLLNPNLLWLLLKANLMIYLEKIATLEADSARGNERADAAEKKISDIEEELKVVGQNLQTLEVGEEKTIHREEALQSEIMELRNKLQASEYSGNEYPAIERQD